MRRACAGIAAVGLLLIGATDRVELGDPTRPALVSAARRGGRSHDPLRLQSLLLSRERRVAVIDGRSVEVGDRVGGARVLEIDLTGVRLGFQGRERLLTLTPGSVKKPATGRPVSR